MCVSKQTKMKRKVYDFNVTELGRSNLFFWLLTLSQGRSGIRQYIQITPIRIELDFSRILSLAGFILPWIAKSDAHAYVMVPGILRKLHDKANLGYQASDRSM